MYLTNVIIWGRNPKNFLLAPLAALFCTLFSKLWHRLYINFVADLQLAPAPTIPRPTHFSNQIYATDQSRVLKSNNDSSVQPVYHSTTAAYVNLCYKSLLIIRCDFKAIET